MDVRRIAVPAFAVALTVATGAGAASAAPTAAQDEPVYLAASLLGRNEIPTEGGPAVGDRDGRATAVLRIQGDRLSYALRWKNIAPPTAGHIHLGARGANGAVKVPLFAAKTAAGKRALSGSVKVDPATRDAILADPTGFYANLHNGRFPGGAVRGQLHKLIKPVDLSGVLDGSSALNAPVLAGAQIYRCTQQADGTYAYTQEGVTAILSKAIRHSFVEPAVGPPQWIAPDGSAVTGKAIVRTPNAPNIPELVLDATQSGAKRGLLASTTQILRLNTIGGAAPTGTCTPQKQLRVPYQADYVFLG